MGCQFRLVASPSIPSAFMIVPAPANPNIISLNPVNGQFSTNLPARLVGIITQGQFAASIDRCNEAFRTGNTLLLVARLIIFAGVAIWAICWGVGISQMTKMSSTGPNVGMMFGGIGAMIVCSVIGQFLVARVVSRRVTALQAAVSAEHGNYSGRVGPPISWSMSTTTVHGYRRVTTTVQIDIEIGGGQMIVMVQPPYQPQLQQQQPPPYQQAVQSYQPYSGQPYRAVPQAFPAQPQYAQPVSHAPSAPPQYGQPVGRYGIDIPTNTSEGSPHPVAIPVAQAAALGVCDRCNRTANTPEDRFCARSAEATKR